MAEVVEQKPSRELCRHNLDIVAQMPGVGASKMDVQFYVGDLLSRMKFEEVNIKRQALMDLNEFVNREERFIEFVVETDEVVDLLVRFVDSPELEIEEEATSFLMLVSKYESFKGVLIRAGVIEPLVRVLECGSDVSRERCARCLMNLTHGLEDARLVSDLGGVSALLKICVRAEYEALLISRKTRDTALRAIVHLCSHLESYNDVLSYDGFDDAFVRYLQNEEVADQELALKFGLKLCEASAEANKSLGKAGFIEELVRFLDAKLRKIQELAAEALSEMLSERKNLKKFLWNDQNIGTLVGFLDKEGEDPGIKKLVLPILSILACTNSGRSKLVDAGCLEKAEKLLRIEGCKDGAKMLLKDLSPNRIRRRRSEKPEVKRIA